MRFLVIYTPDAPRGNGSQDAARGTMMAEYAKKSADAGILLSQGMFDSAVTQVQQRSGAVSATDRQVEKTGYAYLEAPSHRDAVEMAKEFLSVAGDGVCEVRGVLDAPPQSR